MKKLIIQLHIKKQIETKINNTENSKMSKNKTITKLNSIDSKIEDLKNERLKLVQSLGNQITETLYKKDAFNHDFKVLLQGINFVADELNKNDSQYTDIWKRNVTANANKGKTKSTPKKKMVL